MEKGGSAEPLLPKVTETQPSQNFRAAWRKSSVPLTSIGHAAWPMFSELMACFSVFRKFGCKALL